MAPAADCALREHQRRRREARKAIELGRLRMARVFDTRDDAAQPKAPAASERRATFATSQVLP